MESEEINLRPEFKNEEFLLPVSFSADISPWNEDVLFSTENTGFRKSSREDVDDSSKEKCTDAVSSK